MELGQLYSYFGAQIVERPLLHGSVGFWDDIVGIVGAIILLALLIHMVFFEKETGGKRKLRPGSEDTADREE